MSDTFADMVNKVALLTAGGVAPCLSSAVGGLIERYADRSETEIIAYRYGYEASCRVTRSPSRRSFEKTLQSFTPSAAPQSGTRGSS